MNRSLSVTTTQHHNTQRRIFRGRGGATDRHHLPDHGARRRRHRHESPTGRTNDMTLENNNNDQRTNEPYDDNDHDHDDVNVELYPLEIIDPFVTPQVTEESAATTTPPAVVGEEDHDETYLLLLRQELQHITRRMQQLRRNWSNSKTGLILPSNYATNVMQATLNIIMKEWQSILRQYYSHDDHGEMPTTTRCDAVVVVAAASRATLLRPVSHDLFALIQQSIQCGPLMGCQAGYFKRCGSHVAQMVYDYLTTILPTIAGSDDTPVDRRKVVDNYRQDEVDDHVEDDDDEDDSEDDSQGVDDNNDDDENDNAEAASNIDATTLPHQQQQTDGHQNDEEQQPPQLQNGNRNDVVPAVTCFFTDSQIKMMQTWKRNAYKAAVINPKAPSKSVMHQEYQAQKIQNEKKRIKALKGR